MSPEIEAAIKNLAASYKGDHCALVRSSCAFMVHTCQDEHRLFYQFFTKSTHQLTYDKNRCLISLIFFIKSSTFIISFVYDKILDRIWKAFVQFYMTHCGRTLSISIIWKHWQKFAVF